MTVLHVMLQVLLFICCCYVVVAIPYHPATTGNQNISRDLLIRQYFTLGFSYSEVVAFLLVNHGISVSVRHLKRLLRAMGLQKRKQQSDLNSIMSAIETELKGSGNRLGYRLMHQRLFIQHGLIVDRETVRITLRFLDNEGVDIRSRRKLRRRSYKAAGPNFIWHIDGYDKLKPFGFCVHGAIDGYSRKILWLKVASSNNDPKIVAQYFLECAKEIGGIPRVVRGDPGTENGDIAGIQRFLRRNDIDEFASEKSFLFGKSVANQRIEAWWSTMRKTHSDWWIQLFKELRANGDFCDSDPIHTDCLKFCFMDVLQDELNNVAINWNLHRIRLQKVDSPSGRPDVLYFMPVLQDTQDYKRMCSEDDLDIVEELFDYELIPKCSPEFQEMAEILMNENDLHPPSNAEQALTLYFELLDHIKNI